MLVSLLISLSLSLFYVAVVLYLRQGWKRIPYYSGKNHTGTKVSVLIAARNEEKNIIRTIQAVLNQDYPIDLVEIIVVDDHSTDRTAEIVRSCPDSRVHLLQLNEGQTLNSYKKKAIAEAIKIAQGELMITTDADCFMGPEWISTLVSFYEENDLKMISSPVVFAEEKNSFQQIQTLEFLYLIGLGAAAIGQGRAATCNGANLAYRRDVFYEVNGFKGIDDLASGDDELLLHKVASKYPNHIGFLKSKKAIVYTHAKENLREFIRQRRRWASKSTKYTDKKLVALAVCVWLFNGSILLKGLLSIFYPSLLIVFLFQIILKIGVELYYITPVLTFTKRRDLVKYLPVTSILHIIYIIFIGIAGNLGKYHWKGRMVR